MKGQGIKRPGRTDKQKQEAAATTSFFLACDFSPGGQCWSVVEGFAYDIMPAYILGNLGILSYEPNYYSIIDEGELYDPLMGYLMTITCKEMVSLLDKAKGFLGEGAFNWHERKLVKAHTEVGKPQEAWAYMLAPDVFRSYQSMETVEYGMLKEDEKKHELLQELLGNKE